MQSAVARLIIHRCWPDDALRVLVVVLALGAVRAGVLSNLVVVLALGAVRAWWLGEGQSSYRTQS